MVIIMSSSDDDDVKDLMKDGSLRDVLEEVRREQEVLKMMFLNMNKSFKLFQATMKVFNRVNGKPKKENRDLSMNVSLMQSNLLETSETLKKLREKLELQEDAMNSVASLRKEVGILQTLFIHGDDIKTYDLSTTFPDAYEKIIELEKQRATHKSILDSVKNVEAFTHKEDQENLNKEL